MSLEQGSGKHIVLTKWYGSFLSCSEDDSNCSEVFPMSLKNRGHREDWQEQTGAGQAPGGAREGDHSEGPDGLVDLQPPGAAVPPEPHRHTGRSSAGWGVGEERVVSWQTLHLEAVGSVDLLTLRKKLNLGTTQASLHEGSWFESWFGPGSFCGVCVFSLCLCGVLWVPHTVQRLADWSEVD